MDSVETQADALEWLTRNNAFDSGSAWLAGNIGLIVSEEGDEVDWLDVCKLLSVKLARLSAPSQEVVEVLNEVRARLNQAYDGERGYFRARINSLNSWVERQRSKLGAA